MTMPQIIALIERDIRNRAESRKRIALLSVPVRHSIPNSEVIDINKL